MSERAHILVVDDERSMREFLEIFFRREGYTVTTAESVDTGLVVIENDDIDVVITDMQMPDRSGLDLLHGARDISPETPVIVITAFASTDSAIEAMKEGAYDYITKPFKVDAIRLVVDKALEKKDLYAENRRLKTELRTQVRHRNIIGTSEPMQRIFDLIGQVAGTKTNVLIAGESGTGKERAIDKGTDGYDWDSADAPHSCGYLTEPVMTLVEALGARDVLDLGAGNGALCGALSNAGYRVTGVEFDEAGCKIAREAHPEVDFYNLGVEDDPAPIIARRERGFDLVVSTEVVEHLYAPRLLPRFARHVLAPDGHLLLTTPYNGYLKNLALSVAGKWDFHLNPLWDGGHIKFWSRASLTTLLEDAGFEIVDFQGVGRVPYLWKSMILIAKMRNQPGHRLR